MEGLEKISYTMEGAADAAGFTRTFLFTASANGSLATFKCGRRRMVSRRALEAFIQKLEKESAPKAPRKVRA